MTVNTCSNLGTGSQVFSSIVGTDAQFRTVTGGTGITATQSTNNVTVAVNTAAALSWSAAQNFGTTTTIRTDPAYGTIFINRPGDTLPVDPNTFAVGAYGAFVTRATGTDLVVPLISHGYSAGSHHPPLGAVWGIATEAWNVSTKTGTTGQLIGGEFSIINEISTYTAPRHCGVLVPFKNRGDTSTNPTNGAPTGTNSYNKNASAVYIDTGAGRGTNTTIECGWNVGVYFSPNSLDTAGNHTIKATGIDMTSLDATAPEGGKYTARVISALAVPSDLPISLSTDKTAAQIVFVSATGNIEYRLNGSQRFGVNQSNGTIYSWDGVNGTANNWFIDMVGTGSTAALFNARSSGRIATTATAGAATAVAPAGYIRIKIDGTTYKLAYYNN